MASFPKSKIWDQKTQQSVDAVRAFIHRHPQPTISHLQNESLHDRPLKGPSNLVQDTLPVPVEDDVRRVLFFIIDRLGDVEYEIPSLVPVPVEWVGKKTDGREHEGVSTDRRSDLERLTLDCASDLTIFHVHGGAFFQGSPGSYRPTTSELASLSGGRVVSIQYRLSPQNVFPAAILDVLMAYLSLLYPSPSSAHKIVDTSKIVFAGDSAGGVLLFCVLQIILQSSSVPEPASFHSHEISFPIPKPAGVAVLSLAGDLTHALPSFETNRVNDLFLHVPWYSLDYPSCPIWPTSPPRPDVYCPMKSFLHPFVTLALAKSWEGSPPIWLAGGEEIFADGAKVVARRAARQNVNVDWIQFEAMPHCFPIVPGLTQSKHSLALMEKWAEFCRGCITGAFVGAPTVKASKISFKDLEERIIRLEGPEDPPVEDIDRRVGARVRYLDDLFERGLCRRGQSKI